MPHQYSGAGFLGFIRENGTLSIGYGVLVVAVTLILAQFIGLLIYYDTAHIEVYDNLDGVFVWVKVLKESGLFFTTENDIVPIFGGIGRHYFPSELQLVNLVYYFFSPLDAYYSIYFLKVLLGVASFYLLANYLLRNKKELRPLILLVSIAYAILPGYANLYLAQASIPLIAYLFFRVINEKKAWLYLALFVYPTLSDFPRYGMLILSALGVYFIYCLIKKDAKYKSIFIAMVILSSGYIIAEYHFFMAYLVSDVETIKKVKVAESLPFFKTFFTGFFKGQSHAKSLHYIVIIPLSVYVGVILFKGRLKPFGYEKILTYLLVGILVNALFFALNSFSFSRSLVDLISPLKGWNFGRTIWFNPMLWNLYFLVCLVVLIKNNRLRLAYTFALLQIVVILVKPTTYNDFSKTVVCEFKRCEKSLSYKEFFSEELFSSIKREIEYDREPVLAFGMHPSILSFNGFFTLDGYHSAYSLDYKKRFRAVIAPALDASGKDRKYFDEWGGRAYLFSRDSVTDTPLFKPRSVYDNAPVELLINAVAAKELGAKYIISLYELNVEGMERMGKMLDFNALDSPYHVRVYKLFNE